MINLTSEIALLEDDALEQLSSEPIEDIPVYLIDKLDSNGFSNVYKRDSNGEFELVGNFRYAELKSIFSKLDEPAIVISSTYFFVSNNNIYFVTADVFTELISRVGDMKNDE